MKLVLTAAAIALSVNSISFAQCNKPGDGYSHRPTYRPVTNYKRTHYTPKRSCSDNYRPVAPHIETPYSAQPDHIIAPEPPALRPQIESGQRVTIDGRGFGLSPGSVILRVGQLTLPAQLAGWNNTQTVAVLPQLPIRTATPATVAVHAVDGTVVAKLDIELLPANPSNGGVQPPAQPSEPTVVAPGQTVTLDGANLGHAPGQIQLTISGITLVAQVSSWTDSTVTATLPSLQLAQSVNGEIRIVKANGSTADQIAVVFSPNAQSVASR